MKCSTGRQIEPGEMFADGLIDQILRWLKDNDPLASLGQFDRFATDSMRFARTAQGIEARHHREGKECWRKARYLGLSLRGLYANLRFQAS